MPKKVRPTPRVKKAFKAVVENETSDKPRPMGEILLEAGYSKSTSLRPNTVINSVSFQTLMDKAGITDEMLSSKLKEGLEADKPYGKQGDIHPDYATRHKYLETGLKLKGIQKTSEASGTTNITQINQTNIDPNSKEAKKIVDNTLDILMNQTLAE